MTSFYYEPPSVHQDKAFKGDVSAAYAWAAQVVEVEVDTDTGVVRMLGVTAAHDVGRVLNRLGIEGQIEGGIVMGQVNALAMTPSNVGVRILNGTNTSGLASHASEQLTPKGFEVRGIADSSEKVDTTIVRYGPGERDAAATVARMFPGAKIQSDRTVKSGVELILGDYYTPSSTLKSYATPGTTISADQLPPRVVEANLPSDLSVTNAGDATCE